MCGRAGRRNSRAYPTNKTEGSVVSMYERELWEANLRAITKRVQKHVELALLAQRDERLALAYLRDAMLTPLEAAHAGIALDECRAQQG